MPVIKHISIKRSPLDLLQYITGESKEERAALVSGINCSSNAEAAYQEMSLIYESFTGHKYSDIQEGAGKKRIKMHHYIQSFKGKEITPQEAHKMAQEWANKVFGGHYQILIATHNDSGNIHNHIAVNAYGFRGEHWIDNKKTLQKCRDESDRLAYSYFVSVIEKPEKNSEKGHNYSYTEQLARSGKTSWKARLCLDIDELVMREDITTVEQFVTALVLRGYEVRRGKHLSVRPTDLEKCIPVRTFRLGDGYAIEEIEYRIKYKDTVMTNDDILRCTGVQRDAALGLQILQMKKFRSKRQKIEATYREVVKSLDLLTYMDKNHLKSKDDMERHVNRSMEKCDSVIDGYNALKKRISDYKYLIRRSKRYLKIKAGNSGDEIAEYAKINRIARKYQFFSLDDIPRLKAELEKAERDLTDMEESYVNAKAEKKTVSEHYKHYLDCIETDYEKAIRTARAALEAYERDKAAEKAAQEAAEAERKHQEYLAEEEKFLNDGRVRPKYVPKKEEYDYYDYDAR